jgi:hypothetical protein
MVNSGDDEQDLRRSALVALQAGIIPRDQPRQILGGSGAGEVCPVCGRSIEPAEMELELEFANTEVGDDAREFHLHLPCFAAWEIARKSAEDCA